MPPTGAKRPKLASAPRAGLPLGVAFVLPISKVSVLKSPNLGRAAAQRVCRYEWDCDACPLRKRLP